MTAVFRVPVNNLYLVYAPLHSFVALVDRCAVDQLHSGLQTGAIPSKAIRPILEELSQPAQPPPARSGPMMNPLFLGIIPTRGCSLACRYCDFIAPGNDQTVMSLELARQAVEAYLDLLEKAGQRHVEVHFFGGEPFFAEEVVRFVVDYTALAASRLGWSTHFEAITNGFYQAACGQWIADSFDTIILSLDGQPDIQERQRPARNGRSTFTTIFRNAKIFSSGSAELIVRACVTSETVAQMAATAEWLAQELHPSAVCFETLVASPSARASGLFSPSPWEFGRQFMAASKILAGYGIETVLSTANLHSLQTSLCPVGKDALIVTPSGAVNACYLLEADWQRKNLDLRFGRVNGSRFDLDYPALQRIRSLSVEGKPLCSGCLCRYHCAGGCHVNHDRSGKLEGYSDTCIQTRIVTIARLLGSLGQKDLADSWLQDQQAVEKAVMQPSDRLLDEAPA